MLVLLQLSPRSKHWLPAQASKRSMATDISNVFSHTHASPIKQSRHEGNEQRAAKVKPGTPSASAARHDAAVVSPAPGSDVLVSWQ
jgi:hypothetical protein